MINVSGSHSPIGSLVGIHCSAMCDMLGATDAVRLLVLRLLVRNGSNGNMTMAIVGGLVIGCNPVSDLGGLTSGLACLIVLIVLSLGAVS